jgi:uncharacterized protein
MLVVSDTSPITNLFRIGQLDILQLVYTQIVIPKAVYDELSEIEIQRDYIDTLDWITIAEPQNHNLIDILSENLDFGESHSIVLAIELKADFLIIDELKGRNIAETMGIKIVGLLGTLLKAKEKGYIPAIAPILQKLSFETGFYINPTLKNHILKLAEE